MNQKNVEVGGSIHGVCEVFCIEWLFNDQHKSLICSIKHKSCTIGQVEGENECARKKKKASIGGSGSQIRLSSSSSHIRIPSTRVLSAPFACTFESKGVLFRVACSNPRPSPKGGERETAKLFSITKEVLVLCHMFSLLPWSSSRVLGPTRSETDRSSLCRVLTLSLLETSLAVAGGRD